MGLIFRLAWRNLWRQPRRTWLTTGAMIFTNVLLVVVISLQVGIYAAMIESGLQALTGHMQVQAPGYLDEKKMRQTVADVMPLARSLRAELESDRVAARAASFALMSSESRSFGILIYGVEPEFEANVSSLPRLIDEGRFLSDIHAAEIVIGAAAAKNLRAGIGDELTLLGSGLDGSFAAAVVEIVGIYSSGIPEVDRAIAEIPLGLFQDTFYMEGRGHEIVVNASRWPEATALQARVATFLGDDPDLVVHDWNTLAPEILQGIVSDLSGAVFMYAVLIIVVSFGILNTQMMSVLERTHEFGVVMAIGVSPGRLARIVMLESALMATLALGIGILLGGAVAWWLTVYGFTIPGLDEFADYFVMPDRLHANANLFSISIGPAVVFVFALLSTLYPAARLHRLHPVQAMRAL